MAEVVDSIIAELIAKADKYVADFDRATAAHGRFHKSLDQLQGQTFDLNAEAQKYKQAGNTIAQAEEETSQRVTQSRKKRAADAKAADESEVASAKKAAKAKADAEIVEAERAARAKAAVERGLAKNAAAANSLGVIPNRSGDPDLAARQTAIMSQTQVAGAEAQAAAEKEINHLLLDQTALRASLSVAEGEEKIAIRDRLTYMNLYNTALRANLSEERAVEFAETRLLAIQKARTEQAEKQVLVQRAGGGGYPGRSHLGPLNNFALQASGGRFGYSFSPGAIAGLGVAVGAAATIGAISSSINFAKQIKDTADAVGLTTTQVQIYQRAAEEAGVSSTQFTSAISQLNDNLGKAKTGNIEAAKTFEALGISVKNAGNAGDVLPTIIDRLSKIEDPAKRATLETRLFGEAGRRLDSLLSGGNDKVNDLADSLIRTGQVLSSSDIAKLDDTSKKLESVKAQLQVDLAQIVAGNADAITSLATALGKLTGEVIRFVGAHPQAAATLIGALGGGAIGGLPGAAIGGAGGYLAGGRIAQYQADANTDIGFRRQQLGQAMSRLGAQIRGRRDGSNVDENGGDITLATEAAARKEVERQRQLLDAAVARARENARGNSFPREVQGGAPNSGLIDRLGITGGKSANQLAAEAEQRTKRYNDQLAQSQEQEIRARELMTDDVQERAAIEQELSNRALQRAKDDIDSQAKINVARGGDAALEAARAKELKAAVQKAADAESDAREQQVSIDLARQQNDHLQARLSIEADLLQGSLGFARTAKDRLAIQLRLLDLEKQQEQAALDNQIAEGRSRNADVTALITRRNGLDQQYAQRAQQAQLDNLGPWASYVNRLPRTAGEINEAFQQAAVDGVGALNDSLSQTASKLLGLHGLAGQLLDDFIRIALQSSEARLFGGGGLLGGLFGAGLSIGSYGVGGADFSALPGFASGGTISIAGNAGTDRNLLSINGRPVARVNMGETLAIIPNNDAVRPSVAGSGAAAAFHFDLRGAVMTQDLLDQMNAIGHQAAYVGGELGATWSQQQQARAARRKLR